MIVVNLKAFLDRYVGLQDDCCVDIGTFTSDCFTVGYCYINRFEMPGLSSVKTNTAFKFVVIFEEVVPQ